MNKLFPLVFLSYYQVLLLNSSNMTYNTLSDKAIYYDKLIFKSAQRELDD